MEELLMRGASVEKALEKAKDDLTIGVLQTWARRRANCLAATLALLGLRCVPRDMRRLLAQRVWATRRDAVWDSAVGHKTMRVN
jgi:hypothetical protein